MTIPFDELRRKWRTDPDFVARHEEIAPEMALAFELADARRAAGLTQAQLAERMDTTQSTVARWEKGAQEPSIRSLRKFAHAVGRRVKVELVPE
ncbi:helix-turn-helix transcriptional regulator [Alsobacter sp. KACC 23698]|jgi:DNA-binding transcriptional regulator YiaG|uniref:Helix-turn-helix transcriptional regulator n=1 Tax=Alsobacter sp. KACC 23698 TaxID=3149229 RepID=A0AAU7JAQ1_9HYPH